MNNGPLLRLFFRSIKLDCTAVCNVPECTLTTGGLRSDTAVLRVNFCIAMKTENNFL